MTTPSSLAACAIVRIGPHSLAFDLAFVLGMREWAPPHPESSASPAFLGFTRFQNDDVCAITLAPKLGLPGGRSAGTQLLVLRSREGLRLAVEVDGLVDLESRQPREVYPFPAGFSELPQGFLAGWIQGPAGGALLVDATNLLTDEELQQLIIAVQDSHGH